MIQIKYDIVGSFLRPEAIKKARAEFKSGAITREDLKKVEDEEITKLLNLFHNTEFLCCQAEGSDRSESYSDRKYISSQSHLHTGMPACEDNPMLPPPGEPYSCHRKSFLSLFQARFHYSFH